MRQRGALSGREQASLLYAAPPHQPPLPSLQVLPSPGGVERVHTHYPCLLDV